MRTQFIGGAPDSATAFCALRLDPTVQKMLEGHAKFAQVGVADLLAELIAMQQGQFRSAAMMARRKLDGIARRA